MITAQDHSSGTGGSLLAIATYSYDVFGRMIEEDATISGTLTVTRHAWDGDNSWADLNGSNALQMRYIHGTGVNELLVRESGGGTVGWFFTDRQQSVTGLVNSSGTMIDTITYDGYQNILTESSAANGGNYKGTGVWYDSVTNLAYDKARWYNTKTGNWTSRDPIGFDGGLTKLDGYVGNNPINRVDPSGLQMVSGGVATGYQPPPGVPVGPHGFVSGGGIGGNTTGQTTGVPASQIIDYSKPPYNLFLDNDHWNGVVVILPSLQFEKNKGEVNGWATSALEFFGKGTKVFVNVQSVEDLAGALSKFPKGSIKKLVLGGHGGNCGIWGVYGDSYDAKYTISDKTLAWNKNAAATIASRLAPKALVEVQGCNSGANGKSAQSSVQLLANLLKATVRAPTGSVTGWNQLQEGTEWVERSPDDQDVDTLYKLIFPTIPMPNQGRN